MNNSPAVSCRSVGVAYGNHWVLSDIDLEIAAGETLSLLGPSGSGKTTLLHALAGFLPLRSGEIHLAGQLVASPQISIPPERRSVGMVFQNYALWPHLNAAQTVAYPLRRAGQHKQTAHASAVDILSALGIAGLADRRPGQLSGGQQQRVGLARALARRADLYLFDEPTAHLDAAVRESVATEMMNRQRDTGAAAIYSTHDATEALAVADRVAVLREGRLVQTGTPFEVYEQPRDLWVARLTGPASTFEIEGKRQIVRPDWVGEGGPVTGIVREAWFRGTHTDYRVETSEGPLAVRLPGPPRLGPGDESSWTIERSHPIL